MKYTEILQANRVLGKSLTEYPAYEVVVLSNIVTSQVNDILEYSLRSKLINARVRSGDYDNILQESRKYTLANTIIVFWELGNLIDGLHYKAPLMNIGEVEALVEKTKSEIDFLFRTLAKTSVVIFNEFSSLTFNHHLIKDNELDQICDSLNRYVKENCPNNFVLININKILVRLSIERSVDFRFFYTSRSLYSIEFYKEYVDHICPIIFSARGLNKKALIVDCDNTIWKGIVGEDGIDGIELSAKNKDGAIFEEIQHLILALSKQGIIIGICSKNNFEDIEEVFFKRSDMTLKDKDILIKKINWENKTFNLREIASELNIGLDSLVFLDDSSFEIEFVRENLPEITALQVTKRTYDYPQFLRKNLSLFYKSQNTSEDKKRLELYKDEQKRQTERDKFGTIEEYLKSLSLQIEININNRENVSRVAQLTQKTNQFNLTTTRFTEAEIEKIIDTGGARIYTMHVRDKFGDYGLTGVVIVKQFSRISVIEAFLMSCRVIGRNIEIALFNFIANDLKLAGQEKIESQFIKSNKNSQVERFYDDLGFRLLSNTGQIKKYAVDLADYKLRIVDYITLLNNPGEYGGKN